MYTHTHTHTHTHGLTLNPAFISREAFTDGSFFFHILIIGIYSSSKGDVSKQSTTQSGFGSLRGEYDYAYFLGRSKWNIISYFRGYSIYYYRLEDMPFIIGQIGI